MTENNSEIFQMMADSYKDTLKMERVKVIVADHSYFQQNPSAVVCYQHPHIIVYPKWQERSNHVRLLSEMENVMKEARDAHQRLAAKAEGTKEVEEVYKTPLGISDSVSPLIKHHKKT